MKRALLVLAMFLTAALYINAEVIETTIQEVQEVTEGDDASYMVGDTVKVTGIVTTPTGLHYAGSGVKFVMQDEDGGPWSGILLYSPNGGTFPDLFIGDKIEATGYVSEYVHGGSEDSLTEIFITEEITIVDFGLDVPAPIEIDAAELGASGSVPNHVATAEKYEECMIKITNATVTEHLPYDNWIIADESGSCVIGNDSDSLDSYFAENPLPPVGTAIDEVIGWVHPHYEYYKIEPNYMEDIVIGVTPPEISDVMRDKAYPTSSETITVTAEISDSDGIINTASLYYNVDGGDFMNLEMTTADSVVYQAEIPAQADGSWVTYYVHAIDNAGNPSYMPNDTAEERYGYTVKDAGLTIYDVEFTPFTAGNSFYAGYEVTVEGVVTADTSIFGGTLWTIQMEDETEWAGLWIDSDPMMELTDGDKVLVTGTVKEQYGLTIMKDVTNVEKTGTGTYMPQEVTALEVETGSDGSEKYEGMLIKLISVEVVEEDLGYGEWAIGCYTCGGDKALGSYRVDDYADYSYVPVLGDQFEFIMGIHTYTYSDYKLEPRGDLDFQAVGIDDNPNEANSLSYKLYQNSPNPFNPVTEISFKINKTADVNLSVYSINGRLVKTIENRNYNSGTHSVIWDGTDNNGSEVSSGLYFYRLTVNGNESETEKMMLIK